LLSSVNVVSQEEVVGIGWEATILEKSQEIVVLPMNIAYLFLDNCALTTNLDRSLKLEKDGLINENVTSLNA